MNYANELINVLQIENYKGCLIKPSEKGFTTMGKEFSNREQARAYIEESYRMFNEPPKPANENQP